MAFATMTTGTVAGHAAEFTAVHRQANETPATVQMTMTLPMSLEDITAALWILVSGGYELADLESPEHVHAMVLETVHAEGASELDSVRLQLADIRPGSRDHAMLRELRKRVRAVYGPGQPGAPARGRSPHPVLPASAGRELAGVS